jgi:hypothetical protein
MEEGYSAPATGGKLQALQFFALKGDAAVVALIDSLTTTPVEAAVQLVNVAVFALFAILAGIKFFNFVYRAGASGDAEWDAVGAWATRVCVALLIVAPISGTWTGGQLAVFYLAKAGSAFADRVANAAGPAREAMRPASRVGANGVVTARVPGVAPQAGEIVATVLQARWCQNWLARTIGPQATIPDPTIETRADGLRVYVFGPPTAYAEAHSTVDVPRDVCGMVSLPSGGTVSAAPEVVLDPNGFGMPQFVDATVAGGPPAPSTPILEAHRIALDRAVTEAAAVVSNFNLSANGKLVTVPDDLKYVNEAPRIRAALRAGAQKLALEYTRTVMAAGGGTKSEVKARPSSELDGAWGWIKYGMDFHARAAGAVEASAALTWTPTSTSPNIARMQPAPPTSYYAVLADELRSAGLLPAMPSSPTANASAGGGGFTDAIVKFFDVGRLLTMFAGFEDPAADPFEVAAATGPVMVGVGMAGLTAYSAISAAVPGPGTFVSIIAGTLIGLGQVLSIAVPAAPLTGWLMLVLGWFASVVSLAVTVTFIAFSMVRDDAPEMLSQSILAIFGRVLLLLFAPALLVLGMTLITPIMQLAWLLLSIGIMPVMRAAASGSIVTMFFASIFAALFIVTVLISVVYFAVSRITSLLNDAEKLATETVGRSLGVGEKIEGDERVNSANIGSCGSRGSSGGGGAAPAAAPAAAKPDASKNIAANVPGTPT